jgi:arginine deiminase
MQKQLPVSIYSEIGDLESVIIHSPGQEVENMTPENAERALYSDILNLVVARKEFSQLKGVLELFANTYEVKALLKDIITNEKFKEVLIDRICQSESAFCIRDHLLSLDEDTLTRALIEGVKLTNNTLTNFLSKERFNLRPLHNFFFTRDAAISVYDQVFVGAMASPVRLRESLIMESIFDFHPMFSTRTVNPHSRKHNNHNISFEGGDVLIARDDILLCGIGSRSTSEGIDFILKNLIQKKEKQHILVQELPLSPESFIHLDMVFTLLDKDICMIYEPVIMKMNKYQTVHLYAEGGKVKFIREVPNLPAGLQKLGMDLQPVLCGGARDSWQQEREQWHSGANFFSLSPGKIVGYARNVHTLEALNKSGFEIVRANDLIKGKVKTDQFERMTITLDGSELPRGGGGARCMTMPVSRKAVDW